MHQPHLRLHYGLDRRIRAAALLILLIATNPAMGQVGGACCNLQTDECVVGGGDFLGSPCPSGLWQFTPGITCTPDPCAIGSCVHGVCCTPGVTARECLVVLEGQAWSDRQLCNYAFTAPWELWVQFGASTECGTRPAPMGTIQTAVEALNPNGTINIQPGLSGPVQIHITKPLTLVAPNGPATIGQ